MTSPELTALHESLPRLPVDCGGGIEGGVSDSPEWFDWSVQHTTPDQLRIERYLDHFDLGDCSVLHVGTGNSSLARRLAGRCRCVVGTTVSEAEVEIGRGLGLPNYQVLLHNKHGEPFAGHRGQFDFIVDNNPTTFSCCLKHLLAMMRFYADALAPGGQIVTDRVGLGWSLETKTNPTPWDFTVEEFSNLAKVVGLDVTCRGDFTVIASAGKPRSPNLPEQAAWVWRKAVRAGKRLNRQGAATPAIAE